MDYINKINDGLSKEREEYDDLINTIEVEIVEDQYWIDLLEH